MSDGSRHASGFRMGAVFLALAIATSGTSAWAGSGCPDFDGPIPVGILSDGRITEVSGIVASSLDPGVFWIHEDSGADPVIYAISLAGDLLATCELPGIAPVDCEDIALGFGPGPGVSYVYLADIGDNEMRRNTIAVYRFAEPRLKGAVPDEPLKIDGIESFELVYPDRPHDAETLLVDPLSGEIYVITKWDPRSRIYRARLNDPVDPIPLEYVGDLPFAGATGGDISPDGRWIVIRTYFSAYIWQRDSGASIAEALRTDDCPVPVAQEPQGEAICFSSDGEGYITISEGVNPVIYLVEGI